YVLLAGSDSVLATLGARFRPVLGSGSPISASQSSSTATLTVGADHLDIRDRVRTSISAPAIAGGGEAFDQRGFDQVYLNSTGDVRFLNAAIDNEGTTALTVPGDLMIS